MRRVLLPIVAGLFLFWVAFVLFATRMRGPGLGPDSMSYLAAAESIARGAGPEVPIADWSQRENHSRLRHFPPLFPALIAAPVSLGLPAAEAARWLEALAAGALAALLACIAASCVVGRAHAQAAALGTGLGVLFAPAISLSFFMVLSEPVFLTFWAFTLLLMVRAPTACFALGCSAACCALTRYAGVSVVAAVALWMLWQRGPLHVRWTRALIATAPSLAALSLWRAWSGGEFRRYAWYLDGFAANAQQAWDTLSQAWVPIPETAALLQPWSLLVSAGVAAVTVLLLMAAGRVPAARNAATLSFAALLRAAALLTGSYLGVVVASRLRADPEIPFDWRILSPVIMTWQLTLSVAIVRRWHSWRSMGWRICASMLCVSWLGAAMWNAVNNVAVMQREGALYDAPEWQESSFARWLRGAGRQYALYSNNPAVLWHLDHRSSWLLPETLDSSTRAALLERLNERPSAVLGFRDAFVATSDPYALGLPLRQCFEQVCVWSAPDALVSEAR